MKALCAMIAVSCVFAGAASAKSTSSKILQAKHQYRHADGYIKSIGAVARRTIYHPNPRIRHRWQRDLRYLMRVMHRAYLILHPPPRPIGAWLCIHHYEGAWTANTGNGYYGGLQMDQGFMTRYGPEFVARWGTADNWPPWAQIQAAIRARDSGRGYTPWPNTARFCGLL